MCLAIPSKIVKIETGMGTIDVDGVQRTCSLLLLDNPQVGDWVIVHAGFALHKIDETAAMETLRLLKEAAAFAEGPPPDEPPHETD
ncbi:MAG: hypothetical protein AMJ54_09665 [Deltaproteobacteria bacterium SG8_13]|nr:MAG: hypothetical protein AMJ54_09665 [Deltaproteobacteria bacterium SG8_13]